MNYNNIRRQFEEFRHNAGRIEDKNALAAINFLADMLEEVFGKLEEQDEEYPSPYETLTGAFKPDAT